MSKIVLRHLTSADQTAFINSFNNFPKEKDFDYIPDGMFTSQSNFNEFLITLEKQKLGIDLPPGYVPATLLFAFNEQGVIVGRSSIRHQLNGFLEQFGGHIGYGVLPSFRKCGHASEILRQTLEFCRRELGLSRVLLTCDDDNLGSRKTIEKNHGVLENKLNSPKGILKRRYWIGIIISNS